MEKVKRMEESENISKGDNSATTEPRQSKTSNAWEEKKKGIVERKVNTSNKPVDTSTNNDAPSQDAGLSSAADIIGDTLDTVVTQIPTHPNGKKKFDENGVPTCVCGHAVMLAKRNKPRSPHVRCSGAAFCTEGDSKDGMVFAKSWWIDDDKTPSEIRNWYLEQTTDAKPIEEIDDLEAPF
mgnify:FL=1|tara:strand:+ start:6145 stop:6687 length:543 start_codon:yes stop_codon:yes gene_type:complete